jgi:hypothetical protein
MAKRVRKHTLKDRGQRTKAARFDRVQLETLIEEATVDCYNDEEAATGLFTMIAENLEVPFNATILGVVVCVERIDMNDAGEIVAICRRNHHRQAIPILDLPLPAPPPAGSEWIAAYRHWVRGR